MRTSQQKWNSVVARLEIVVSGSAQTGLSPTVSVQRVSDGNWLRADGSWGAIAALAMSEPSSVDQPGYYEYAVPTGSLDYAAGSEGYLVKYAESTLPLLEYESVAQVATASAEAGAGAVASSTATVTTLGSWAPATAQLARGLSLTVLSGTGAGQTRRVTAYTAGRQASVFPSWATTPDSTSVVVLHGPGDPAGTVWLADVEALFGGSGGLNLPPTDGRQQFAAAMLQATAEASLQGFVGASFWRTTFEASAIGTTSKFYFLATEGPAVADSAYWAGHAAVIIVAASGRRVLVRVTGVATDGAVHFTLTLPDGSVLPAAPAVGDRLVVLQGDTAGLTVSDIFSASMSAYETAGTFGNHVNRMLRLRQENTRVVYTAWASNGQPTAGYVLTYASASDLNTDTGPGWALAKSRHDFAATYDVDLQLTGYESAKTA